MTLNADNLTAGRSKLTGLLLVLLLICLIGTAAAFSLAAKPAGADAPPAPATLTLGVNGRVDLDYSGASFSYSLLNLVLSGSDQNGNAVDLSGQTITWSVDSKIASLGSDGHTLTITGSGPAAVTASVGKITSNVYVINVGQAVPTASLTLKVFDNGAAIQSVTVTAAMIDALNPNQAIRQYSYLDAAGRHKYYSGMGAPLTDIISRYTSISDLHQVRSVTVTASDNYQAWWPCYQMDVQHLLFGPLYYYPDGTGTNPMNGGYAAFVDDSNKQVVPTLIATTAMGDPLRHFTSLSDLDSTRTLRIYTGMQNINDSEDNNSVKWVQEIDISLSANSSAQANPAAVAPASAPPPSTATPVFADVPASYWASEQIAELNSLGCVSGYPGGRFRPDSSVTRAEFVSMLVKALKLTAANNTTPGFGDLSPGDWCYQAVASAVYYGIVKGDGQAFHPGQAITREEVAAMLVNAMGKQDEAKSDLNEQTVFTDDARIDAWARGCIAVAVRDGLLRGYPDDNSFRPQGSATRAEACAMIRSLLKVNPATTGLNTAASS